MPQDKLKDFDKHMADERRKRMFDRKHQRKEERRQKWYQEKEEAAQKARDEMLKRGENTLMLPCLVDLPPTAMLRNILHFEK